MCLYMCVCVSLSSYDVYLLFAGRNAPTLTSARQVECVNDVLKVSFLGPISDKDCRPYTVF